MSPPIFERNVIKYCDFCNWVVRFLNGGAAVGEDATPLITREKAVLQAEQSLQDDTKEYVLKEFIKDEVDEKIVGTKNLEVSEEVASPNSFTNELLLYIRADLKQLFHNPIPVIGPDSVTKSSNGDSTLLEEEHNLQNGETVVLTLSKEYNREMLVEEMWTDLCPEDFNYDYFYTDERTNMILGHTYGFQYDCYKFRRSTRGSCKVEIIKVK